jgi:hypothetical protein
VVEGSLEVVKDAEWSSVQAGETATVAAGVPTASRFPELRLEASIPTASTAPGSVASAIRRAALALILVARCAR